MILALHGFLGSGEDFSPFRQAMSKYREAKSKQSAEWQRNARWNCPSLFAKSSTLPKFQGFHDFADYWIRTLQENREQLAARPRVLMGYSLGGRLALQLFSIAPELWDHCILVSAHPGLNSAQERSARREHDAKWAERFRAEEWGSVIAAWNDQPVLAGSPPARFEGDFDRERLASAFEVFSLGRQEPFLPSRETRTKVTYVVGEKDIKYAQLAAELGAAKVVRETVVLPGAGHRVLFEQPEALAARLVQLFEM